jgi:glucan phosphorylase
VTLIFLLNIIVFFKPLIEKKLFNYDKKNHAWADETSVDALKISFEFYLKHSLADDYLSATERDLYTSLALSVRDRLIKKWLLCQHSYYENDVKRVYYLSKPNRFNMAIGAESFSHLQKNNR